MVTGGKPVYSKNALKVAIDGLQTVLNRNTVAWLRKVCRGLSFILPRLTAERKLTVINM